MKFSKYHGAGNDFVIIDDRDESIGHLDATVIKAICDRHFGVGADGLMLLRNDSEVDFKMVYFNSDGNQSSMCGNGGRCLVAFAKRLGVIDTDTEFSAIDGRHHATLLSEDSVSLQMNDVASLEVLDKSSVFLDTGSPHVVVTRKNIKEMDLVAEAQVIRNSERFVTDGVNVNFVELIDEAIHIRTYERGVENETLACGTGVTAAAIALHYLGLSGESVNVKAIGGSLSVRFKFSDNMYQDVWKTGPIKHVFEGTWIG
ncbi:diaminopimelate epimerase [Salibacteraceae bacterium]|jgi:diaminopimelate epimerase|nr:diaminopimelate epimerase [Flavobacteriales bacterium]MDC1202619.1 diaminopimelate epimerase [Salibacteraceae bacterium]HAW21202.1 diaminopimelate epimerase [Flavobacteriales bacterium]